MTRRAQKVIVEFHAEDSWFVMLDDGQVIECRSRVEVQRAVSRAAATGNPGVTITTVEWRNLPPGFPPLLWNDPGTRHRGGKV